LTFLSAFSNAEAQNEGTFTNQDTFSIPELQGSVRFLLNGSYSSATLENGTWFFRDLRFNLSQPPIGSLKISAQNSNVTIISYRVAPPAVANIYSQRLFYTVNGQGTQIIDFCLPKQTRTNEWMMNLDGQAFVNAGHGWELSPQGSLVVTGVAHNASFVHYVYVDDSDQPFLQRHSIILTTAAVLACTVAVALVIKFKVRR
jgi:hypothetical protein